MIELTGAHSLLRIALFSTNQLVRLGVEAVFKTHAHIRLIGEAMTVYGAEEVIAREKPDILLVEMSITADILEWIRKLKTSIPNIKIILLSGIEETRTACQAPSSGIDGMVLSIQPTAALLATIDYVCRKPPNSVLPEFDRYNGAKRLNGPTLAIAREGHSSLKGLEGLTKREHEIIEREEPAAESDGELAEMQHAG